MTKKDKSLDRQINLTAIGLVALIATPVFYVIPLLFIDFICDLPVSNGCSWGRVGIAAYSLLAAAIPFLVSMVCFVISFVLYLKARK